MTVAGAEDKRGTVHLYRPGSKAATVRLSELVRSFEDTITTEIKVVLKIGRRRLGTKIVA